MRLVTLSILAIPFLIACGSDLSSSSLYSSQESKVEYVVDSDISACNKKLTNELVDSVIYASEKIGEACEKQNKNMNDNGYRRCPTNTCMSVHQKGGMQAPSMEIKVSNHSGSSSFGYGSFGSSYSRGSTSTGTNLDKVYITVSLKMNLAKDPDQISCINPLSPQSVDRVMQEVIELNKKDDSC
jgi:hypothetical protein